MAPDQNPYLYAPKKGKTPNRLLSGKYPKLCVAPEALCPCQTACIEDSGEEEPDWNEFLMALCTNRMLARPV